MNQEKITKIKRRLYDKPVNNTTRKRNTRAIIDGIPCTYLVESQTR